MKARVFWITLGALLALIIVSFVVATQWFQGYLRGKEFLALISNLTGSSLRSTATFEPLRWTGASAYSETVTLQGNPGSGVGFVDARQLRADMNWRAILDGAWRIEEINITQLDGDFAISVPQTDEAPPPTIDVVQKPSPLLAWLPRRFELGRARIANANLTVGPIRSTDTSLVITPEGKGWQIAGSGGELYIPLLPKLKIQTFRAREQGGDFFLSDSALTLGESGKISASGASADGGSLRINWDGIEVGAVAETAWKKYLFGTLSGSAALDSTRKLTGEMRLTDGRIEHIPMLALVADFTGNPSFRRMPLQEMVSKFSYTDGALTFTNFSAESKGLLRMEGHAKIGPGETLDGQFEIGVTPQTLQWLPGSRERVFRTARDGYLWTTLIIGGTLANPREDLSARLTTAMGQELIQRGTDALQNVPASATEGVKGILDILRPFVP